QNVCWSFIKRRIIQCKEISRSIEVGKDVDIAIFDGNPMVTFTNTMYTIINGDIIYNRKIDNKEKENKKKTKCAK
ncbi:MAG: hypothetical protein WBJ13_13370, partial [Sedimentibacter sp.]